MRFLDAFNEVLELAIPFGQEPRHKVHPARGIVSARWRISDFLADFEFMKHVQLAAPCLRSSRNVSFAPPPVASPAGRATPEPARAYRNLHLFCGAAVVQTVRQRYYLIGCL